MILLLLSTTLEEIVSCVYNVHIITTDVHVQYYYTSVKFVYYVHCRRQRVIPRLV